MQAWVSDLVVHAWGVLPAGCHAQQVPLTRHCSLFVHTPVTLLSAGLLEMLVSSAWAQMREITPSWSCCASQACQNYC